MTSAAPTAPRRQPSRGLAPRALRLTPLMAALAAVLPLAVLAQPRPAATAVPVPAASWRVQGSGAAAPRLQPNARGGVDQTIQQDSQRAIYQWQSFDIGAASSVTFDMALKGGSALNRVTSSTQPSQIFGQLTATNGGEVYLINPNGILFGQGAQVNTGSLVASALNISDAEYLSGLTNNLLYAPGTPAFRHDGAPEDYIDSKSFVRVEEGARLSTDNGGRIFLFAKRVDNAGQISTPGGQAMLAAGGEVYLQTPDSQALYAAESNPDVPTLRGLLVEVGSGPTAAPEGQHGTVNNLATGQISSPRGNTTLVGLAVNQLGRVSATTSVTENGSIILRAQGNARMGTSVVAAQTGGALVLGEGSRTDISPDDDAARHGGQALTSDGNATFVAPQVELAGASVLLDRGAQVVAPGAVVDVRAYATPNREASGARTYASENDDSSRIVLAEDALIDVSGTSGAASVSRYFVTTELLGSNDLKDAPLQKDGLLYRSQATLDVRDDSAILGNLDNYRNGLQQDIHERLSAGGQVRLSAGGAVLSHDSSRIDVSGGQMSYSGAEVRETQLISASGQAFDLNSAPADQLYTQALNLQSSAAAGYDRWGVRTAHGQLTPTRLEAGYVEGRAAGAVSVVAPTVQLHGGLAAHTVSGERQRRGDDGDAQRGSLSLGAVTWLGTDFASDSYRGDAVLRDFSLSAAGPAGLGDWAQALTAALPGGSGLGLGGVQSAGFGTVQVAAVGHVSAGQDVSDAALDLGDQGTLRLMSFSGDVQLDASVRSAGGQVLLLARQGQATLGLDQVVDLSGRTLNLWQDGPLATAASTGGSFEARGSTGVLLGAGSLVDVSGGAVVGSTGTVQGAAAGAITLDHSVLSVADDAQAGLQLHGELRGQSLGAGGSLTLRAPQVQVGGETADAGVFHAQPDLFTDGGFASVTLDGRHQLNVEAGTLLVPRRDEWLLDPRLAQTLASGSRWQSAATAGPAEGVAPVPMSLALRSSGTDVNDGRLVMAEGARIVAPPRSSVQLSARNELLLGGTVIARGGQVSASISAKQEAVPDLPPTTQLWVGDHALIDVSGAVLLTPTTNGLRQGQVLAGGSISLAAKGDANTEAVLVVQQGARLVAHGAAGELDRSTLAAGGVRWQRETVASRGGSISLEANRALVMEGTLDLQGGAPTAAGGQLNVRLWAEPSNNGDTAPENQLRELRINPDPTVKTAGLALGDTAGIPSLLTTASVSAAVIHQSGAADLSLSARDALRFLNGVDLDLTGTLSLSARALAVQPEQDSLLRAGQVQLQGVRLDNSLSVPDMAAKAGTGQLTVEARDGLLLAGDWTTRDIDQLTLRAGGDLMLQGYSATAHSGSLHTAGDLTLSGRQIYPGTASAFSLQAPEHTVRLAGTGAVPQDIEQPLSAGASLTISAAQIEQGGVVRAPQGEIVLRGEHSVQLLPGSDTSVASTDLLLPYGNTTSSRWTAPDGSLLTTLPTKHLAIEAPEVDVQAGARVDLSGGGDLLAPEFVAGRGGSTDVFAGGNGAFALLPGVHQAASYDNSLAGAASLGRQITLGPGGPLPAGTYTLLPARYALQPGAYLIEPVSSSVAYGLGAAVTQADGSVWVGARLGTAGTPILDPQTSTWRLSSGEQARRRSEIRETSANAWLADAAQRDGLPLAERPMDAGTLSLATTSARLTGELLLQAGVDAARSGRGGRAEFSAAQILVGSGPTQEGQLQLEVDTLNALGARTVVLGAQSGSTNDQGQTTLVVGADSLHVNTAGGKALRVPDLVLAAKQTLDIAEGSQLGAIPLGEAAATAYLVRGDGAALRLAGQTGATLQRDGVRGQQGSLNVGQKVQLVAPEGSLVLDATADTKVAGTAWLPVADITLGAPSITIGGPVGGPGVLSLTPALTAQVSQADQLRLQGYEAIQIKDGAVLGEDSSGRTTLNHLLLDTPVLRAGEASSGARITAGEITLGNRLPATNTGAIEGSGQLTLSARTDAGGSGLIRLDEGSLRVQGAQALTLQAAGGVLLDGRQSALATAGDLRIQAPALQAGTAGASSTLTAGGTLQVLGEGAAAATLPAPALGGALQAEAERVELRGQVLLPGGTVQLTSQADLLLAAGSLLDVAGRRQAVGEATVDLSGGQVQLRSQAGELQLAGGRIDVSAAGQAAGGQLVLAAEQGGITLGTDLVGQAAGLQGARLSVDSARAVDLAALAATMDEATVGAFDGQISLRQRTGDVQVAAGTTLRAQRIALSADAGALQVQGRLLADAADGGEITLAAGRDLTLAAGAELLARATTEGGEGGRVHLSTTDGRLQLLAGSAVDVSAGAAASAADAGRLLLRAPRLGISDAQPGGQDVAIDALAGRIIGSGRIDVEAVKVYDGVSRVTDSGRASAETLLTGTLESDGLSFVGNDGQQARQMAERLAHGDTELQAKLRLHAGAEIRADGDLLVDLAAATWSAPSERVLVGLLGGDNTAVGDTSLSLRAAGDLSLGSSLVAGQSYLGTSAAGGSMRLVAGADLAAAAITATRSDGTGDLRVSATDRGAKDLSVTTTTGDLQLAAAGDIQLGADGSYRTRLYSTGLPNTDDATQTVRREMFLFGGFNEGAGDVSAVAGGSVRGSSNQGATPVHPNQWMVFRRALGGTVTWDADPARGSAGFKQGLGSFGGGRITVQAGQDVDHLVVASPGNGFLTTDGSVHAFGGGSVQVMAGRDVVGGVLQAGGTTLAVQAGRDVLWGGSGDKPGLTLVPENTTVTVEARRDLTVGSQVSGHALDGRWISGLAPDASLRGVAAGGDLVYRADRESETSANPSGETRNLWPSQVILAAPSGDLSIGADRSQGTIIQQAEATAARLEVLAAQDLTLRADLQINASWTQGVAYHDADGQDTNSLIGAGLPGSAWQAMAYGDLQRGDGNGLDRTDRTPARFIAAEGDLTLRTALRSARPLRLLAGGDLLMTGTNVNSGVEVQHQPGRLDDPLAPTPSELSLLQAGGDIRLGAAALRMAGPGDLLLLAGRDIDLGRGAGVQAVGNIDNASRLPEGSAHLSLVAGLRADGADHAQASRRGFAVLGASALAGRAGDLYAWLTADRSNPPALGSSAALAFQAQSTDGQLAQVQGLLGSAAYDAALARYVRGLVGHAGDSDARALQAFAALSEVKRAAAPAALLAEAFGALDAAQRLPFIGQVAQADTPDRLLSLVDFVARHSGQVLTPDQALAAFEALPVERQMLRLNQVLVDELRSQGRAAVSARLASEKEAAYDRAYASLNTLFPVDRASGEIRLPATQLRSLQGSDITLLTPGGGINAGETGSSSKSASELGVVTVAGGDIAGVARDDILVNQSRIFTLAEGDILLWSSTADVDAGRGAKTVAGAPPPVYRLDSQGRIVVDTSGSFSGSGIAVLDADSALDLYAPAGAIDAGEAGIRALGTVVLGAQVVRGADDIQGGSVQGAPAAASTVGLTAGLAATAAGTAAPRSNEDEEDQRKKRRARRQLLLEFLGFGRG